MLRPIRPKPLIPTLIAITSSGAGVVRRHTDQIDVAGRTKNAMGSLTKSQRALCALHHTSRGTTAACGFKGRGFPLGFLDSTESMVTGAVVPFASWDGPRGQSSHPRTNSRGTGCTPRGDTALRAPSQTF